MTRRSSPRAKPRAVRTLPRGPHQLSADAVSIDQRQRMYRAVAQVVATKGYAKATVADIVEAAGVSRTTFYGQFRDKEACYLAAYDATGRLLLSIMRSNAAEEADGPAKAAAALDTYLAALAAWPDAARAFLVESLGISPTVSDCRLRIHEGFAAFFTELDDQFAPPGQRELLPDGTMVALVAAVNELVNWYLRDNPPAELPHLAPTINHLLMLVARRP